MLTQKQIKEIREHLDKAQNPIFFYDNDQDGLCSFLLLRRYIERGKGVCIKSYPALTKEYFRKVEELGADYIFILDKPIVADDFFEESLKFNIPIVWIDHHNPDEPIKVFNNVNYYNSLLSGPKTQETGEPVTYICYKIANKKEDMWIALIGCLADRYFPEFYDDFKEKYPELTIESKNPAEIFYKSKIGELARIFSFGLKDRTTNVVKMQKFLIKAKSPYDVLEETKDNFTIHYKYNELNTKYQKFLKKAIKIGENEDKVLFFKFGGDLSIAGDIAGELNFLFPTKIIFVAYERGDKINMSLRGDNVREPLLEIINNFENATGGGHKNAVGGTVRAKDLDDFKKAFESIVTRR